MYAGGVRDVFGDERTERRRNYRTRTAHAHDDDSDCGYANRGTYADIRRALPDVKLVQVIHVEDETDIDEALAAAEHVDYLLLDSGRPRLQVKELGGTGRVHDWQLNKTIRERSRVPLFLAGGLNPENVAEAIRIVQPFGVDVCSGVRREGKLDEGKATLFINSILTPN
ncbi:MAG: phosphoribosylanthranilate isomerase [bacterium]|nr:phosphoribosylanthranilate isomerase [bacterium]